MRLICGVILAVELCAIANSFRNFGAKSPSSEVQQELSRAATNLHDIPVLDLLNLINSQQRVSTTSPGQAGQQPAITAKQAAGLVNLINGNPRAASSLLSPQEANQLAKLLVAAAPLKEANMLTGVTAAISSDPPPSSPTKLVFRPVQAKTMATFFKKLSRNTGNPMPADGKSRNTVSKSVNATQTAAAELFFGDFFDKANEALEEEVAGESVVAAEQGGTGSANEVHARALENQLAAISRVNSLHKRNEERINRQQQKHSKQHQKHSHCITIQLVVGPHI